MADEPYCINPQVLVRQTYQSATPQFVGPTLRTESRIHSHSRTPQSPTPQSILAGTHRASAPTLAAPRQISHKLEYVPRSAKFSGQPTYPPMMLTVGGLPGPYLEDLLRRKITIDGGCETAFSTEWRQSKWTLDWPGIPQVTNAIFCFDVNNNPVTLDSVAREVCAHIGQLLAKAKKGDRRYVQSPDVSDKWSVQNLRFKHLRIFGMYYYRNTWVPILAIQRS